MSTDTPQSAGPVEVFYSYAQKDDALRNELEKHLGTLKRLKLIKDWHNQNIQAGTDWKRVVNAHLHAATIILLLISSDFMASDYCYSIEMQQALERHKQGKAQVIPIILRPVDLEDTPIASLHALPSNGKPITTWSNRDAAFTDVAKGIREVIQELKVPVATNLFPFTQGNESKIHRDVPLAISSNTMPHTMYQDSEPYQQSFPYHETIDTDEVVALFRSLLQRDSHIRILRLIGEAKMGKSHLLTKVFPAIAEQNGHIRYVVLDMRNRMYAVPDILDIACSFLDSKNFDSYHAAHREWSSLLRGQSWSNQTDANMELDISIHTQARDRDITMQFVQDLSKLNDKLLLLLFDSVSNASEYMQMWLVSTFLPHLSRTTHIRTVIAGRFLPDIHGSYALSCKSYQLRAVTETEDYIRYCQKLHARLAEQSVRDFAHACDYTPGMFVELVYPKFIQAKDKL